MDEDDDFEVDVPLAAIALLRQLQREAPPYVLRMLHDEISDLHTALAEKKQQPCPSESRSGRVCVLPIAHTIRHASARIDEFRERWDD